MNEITFLKSEWAAACSSAALPQYPPRTWFAYFGRTGSEPGILWAFHKDKELHDDGELYWAEIV